MKKIISLLLVLSIISAFPVCASARLVGDVNRDGHTNSSDALDVLRYAVGFTSEIDKLMADVNKDGNINSGDALAILQIAVGTYSGELELNDELITSFKKDKIDPILKTGKYTIATTVISNGNSVPSTIMVKGNDMSVDMEVDHIKFRLLVLDGRCYLVIPGIKVYGETNATPPSIIGGGEASRYIKSEYFKNDGKTYVIETYKNSDGSTVQYYFLNGAWKVTVKLDTNGDSTTQRIDSFKAGVTESNFSLDGYRKVNLNDYV